jgi:single-stranded-DNA-specific exonuclease
MDIAERKFSPSVALKLIRDGIHPVVARALAARGVADASEAMGRRAQLLPYSALKGAEEAAKILADAIEQQKHLRIVADYDADGATACTVGLRALRAFGASVDFIIPDRKKHGYGLKPPIVREALEVLPKPDMLITVDNGIASLDGVAESNKHGVPVLVTDHHLPGDRHPDAICIVNPNQHGCSFPSKALAGCGVIWYVMWALQDELLERGLVPVEPDFDIDNLLPIVAVGTVADVVKLDLNNRILVNEGLARIRSAPTFPGIEYLARAAGKDPRLLSTSDIGFGIGPRINAAGRLESMNEGVETLFTDSNARAQSLAESLNETNGRRKEIEAGIVDEAVRRLLTDVQPGRYSAVLHGAEWEEGVIGIVASRLKERIFRPTFIMATNEAGQFKGSGRSIPGFHLRDALDRVDRANPGLLIAFGGHAMAAGVTVCEGGLETFQQSFEKVAREMLTPADLNQTLEVDGALSVAEMCLDTVAAVRKQVWGQGFLEPVFYDRFRVVDARAIGGGKHLKLRLEKDGKTFEAVRFRYEDAPPQKDVVLNVAYKMDANRYRDETNLQLLVETFTVSN